MKAMHIKLQKVAYMPSYKRVLIILASIFLAFAFCGILFFSLGYDPFTIYGEMFKGSFGTLYGIEDSIVQSITPMLAALGVAIAFKMQIWNIGAEGQICMGTFLGTYAALFCPWIPKSLLLPSVVIAGFIGGAMWAMLAILPNALWKVNETIITLLLNYVAILWVNYLVYGPWRDPAGLNFPLTAKYPSAARMPTLFGTGIHSGFLLAIIIAIALYFIFNRTTWGYEITAIGESRVAAAYGGMNIVKNILLVMLVSGGICGIAGAAQISGISWRLQPDASGGYGYTAIIIAYLSHFNPLIIILVSILFGGLQNGGIALQIIGVPSEVVTMVQGAILFFVLGSEFFTRYRVVIGKKEAVL